MQKKINEILKTKMSNPNTIYVLKGFNSILGGLELGLPHIFNIGIDEDYMNVLDEQNIGKVLMSDVLSIEDGKSYYCLYEEMLLLKDAEFFGFVKAKNFQVEVINIGLFENIYPSFEDRQYDRLVSLFNNEENDNILQKLYTQFYISNGNIFVEYNCLDPNEDNFDTKLIDYYSEKLVEYEVSELRSADVFETISHHDIAQLCLKIFKGEINTINYVNISDNTQNIDYFAFVLNVLGINVIKYNITVEDSLPENHDEYLSILKRINPDYTFRDLKFYKDPFVSNELKSVSQSVIIDEIFKNIESAQRTGVAYDVFVTASTGGGKSLLFQIPAILAAEKYGLLTIVISPLIGLMKDQVKNIESNRLSNAAQTINSEYTPHQKEMIKEKIKNGTCSILYISPETLLSNSDITQFIGDRQIGLMVIDEAHTVATWGKNFRPDYWYLGDYIENLRHRSGSKYNFPIATFTATATISSEGGNDMFHDITESLNMTIKMPYIGNVKRDDIDFDINLHTVQRNYEDEKKELAYKRIVEFIKSKEKTLVYFPYVSLLKNYAERLNDDDSGDVPKNRVGQYFGALDKFEKDDTLNDIRSGDKNLVLATKAFGMGIDIKDIKNVYHFAPTGNLADYVQEIGRAARADNMRGVASTDYFVEQKDFRYIKQLYGLSAIYNENIKGVVNKILSRYRREKKRNFMVSTEEFAHVFNDVTCDDEIESKLKATILAIKKDFVYSRYNYVPLVFKPRSMFTESLFFIPETHMNYVKNELGWDKYLTLEYGAEELTKESFDEIKKTYLGGVYRFNLKKCWDENFNDKNEGITFGHFKYKLMNNDLKVRLKNGTRELLKETFLSLK